MAGSSLPVIHHGRYPLVRSLGGGSFGEVWLARDVLQGDEVAIKLLGPHVALDAALLEAQVMTRLRLHERVVTIRNIELAPPVPFIAMDYMPGGSVGRRLETDDVSLLDAVRWTREGLDGLAHAHDEGVLHRDLKPDNLLLDADGRAVISDFGIAEDTMRGLLVVPHVYVPHMAPELITGTPSSRASDIFAMGCTLYRLLTGNLPFASPTDAAAGDFIAPHRINQQIPMSVSRVVAKALKPNPADRYDDARAMLGALIGCHVSHGWRRDDQSGDLETWTADGADGAYVLRLTQRSKGDFLVAVTRDMGKRPRDVFKQTFGRRSDADRARRNLLVALVESGRTS
jgi:serine/threonine-protein kinase